MTVMLQILISTCNERLTAVPDMLMASRNDVSYIVVHQQFSDSVTVSQQEASDYLQNRQDVILKHTATKGLSVSRNIALNLSTAPFILLADDDIRFTQDAFSSIISNMNKHDQAAAITFRYRGESGEYNKSYPKHGGNRVWSNIFQVSSIEVCLRHEFIKYHQLSFDTRFGLGAEYPVSEENILLSDILDKAGTIYFEPLDIAVHPDVTSGANWDQRYLRARGALFRRTFGLKGGALLSLFFIKHAKAITKEVPFFMAIKLMFTSFFRFKKTALKAN